jgi:Ca2+-binding RTX toxin-like protein
VSARQRRKREKRRRHVARRGSARRRIAAGAGLSVGAAFGIAPAAQADVETFAVNAGGDAGDGTCEATVNECTLRDAIDDANDADTTDLDTIVFQASITGTITLNGTELPTIDEPLTITGPGASTLAVSGNDASRILHINTSAGTDVTVAGLTLTAGRVSGYDGGAIYSRNADLTIQNSTVSESSSVYSRGGGIASNTSTMIQSSTISGNGAGLAGGGISSYGVTIQNSTISGNDGGQSGGGVYSFLNTATIQNSTISGNTASFSGGGIVTYGNSPEPTLTNTLVGNNTAPTGPDLFSGGASPDSFSASFSLIESTSGATVNETVAGSNVTGQDPLLGPLQNNGGPTGTQRPAFNSPAVDQGMAAGGATTDQRGQPRPFDVPAIGNSTAMGAEGADIGAVELTLAEATPPPPLPPAPLAPPAGATQFCAGQEATIAGARATIAGTNGKDVIRGSPRRDVVAGLGGNDTIRGLGGNDLICGGPGRDRLLGGGGNDSLLGEGGADTVKGGKGKDMLKGGAGKDRQVQ